MPLPPGRVPLLTPEPFPAYPSLSQPDPAGNRWSLVPLWHLNFLTLAPVPSPGIGDLAAVGCRAARALPAPLSATAMPFLLCPSSEAFRKWNWGGGQGRNFLWGSPALQPEFLQQRDQPKIPQGSQLSPCFDSDPEYPAQRCSATSHLSRCIFCAFSVTPKTSFK